MYLFLIYLLNMHLSNYSVSYANKSNNQKLSKQKQQKKKVTFKTIPRNSPWISSPFISFPDRNIFPPNINSLHLQASPRSWSMTCWNIAVPAIHVGYNCTKRKHVIRCSYVGCVWKHPSSSCSIFMRCSCGKCKKAPKRRWSQEIRSKWLIPFQLVTLHDLHPTSTQLNLNSPTRAHHPKTHIYTNIFPTFLLQTQLETNTTHRHSSWPCFFCWLVFHPKMHWVFGSHQVDPLNSTVEPALPIRSAVLCWNGWERWYTSIIDAKGTTMHPTLSTQEKRELEEGITFDKHIGKNGIKEAQIEVRGLGCVRDLSKVVWLSSIWNALQIFLTYGDSASKLLGWLWVFLLWDQCHWIVIWRCQHWWKRPVSGHPLKIQFSSAHRKDTIDS